MKELLGKIVGFDATVWVVGDAVEQMRPLIENPRVGFRSRFTDDMLQETEAVFHVPINGTFYPQGFAALLSDPHNFETCRRVLRGSGFNCIEHGELATVNSEAEVRCRAVTTDLFLFRIPARTFRKPVQVAPTAEQTGILRRLDTYDPGGESVVANGIAARRMDVSVVVPVYNRAAYMRECVESVIRSEFHGGLELIIVDDG